MQISKNIAVIAAVSAFALIITAAIFWMQPATSPLTATDFTRLGMQDRIQIRTELPQECWRRVRVGFDGGVTLIQPDLCNGDEGKTTYDSHTHRPRVSSLLFNNSDKLRYYAEFADDGLQVLNGFQLRDDGSKIWEAKLDTVTDQVTTTTYWWNGKVFSVEQRKRGSKIVDMAYFRENGNNWLRFVGPKDVPLFMGRNGRYGLRLAQVFDDGGHLSLQLDYKPGRPNTFSRFRPNGARLYETTMLPHTYDMGPESAHSDVELKPVLVPSEIHVFADDGHSVVRKLSVDMDMICVTKVIDFLPDGSRVEYKVSAIDTVTHIERFDSAGVKTAVEDPKSETMKVVYDQKMTYIPEFPEPQKLWQQTEVSHFGDAASH